MKYLMCTGWKVHSPSRDVEDKYGHAKRLIQGGSLPFDCRLYLLEGNMKQVKRGEIYYADLSPVVGSEQDGTRPVLVIQNDTGNKFSPTTIVAAITSKSDKAKLPTHVIIHVDGLETESVILLEQIRTIDKQRLIRYSGRLDKNAMGRVDHAIIVSFGIKYMEGLL